MPHSTIELDRRSPICRLYYRPVSKLLNDHYGHQAGDDCLAAVGAVLNKIGKRPGDIFARFGGDEFLLVFGNTTTEQSLVPINGIVDAIRKLEIPNEESPTKPI